MNADTRQTLIGVTGMTIMALTALLEGYNGTVATAYFVAVIGLVSPQALDRVNLSSGRQ